MRMTTGKISMGSFNYVQTHIHSDMSIADSCTHFRDYVAKAKELGQTAIASTEHGFPRSWVSKKMLCDDAGIKFIHGVEIYLTEDLLLSDMESGEMKKVRDNYHTILIAKNLEGFKELNLAVKLSSQPDHFYYNNRLTFDEFINLSDNIITTSACLSSPLWKLSTNHPKYKDLINRYDFLEIQPHDDDDQKQFNIHLLDLAEKYNKPLICGTDCHALDEYQSECRRILLLGKGNSYGNEDSFDLTYKNYEQLVNMFEKQNVLMEKHYLEAIENTNRLADMCEDWELDKSIKYPILYGSAEEDKKKLVQITWERFDQKVKDGIIKPDQVEGFKKAIPEELRVFKKVGMPGFVLSMAEIVSFCKECGIPVGPARGSVGGSRVAYITDITDLNPEQWDTNFARFCNEDRVEVGDIDIDVIRSDRPKIFEFVRNKFGIENTARVAAYDTLGDKSTIDLICRALMYKWNLANGYKKDEKPKENPMRYEVVETIKKLYDKDPIEAKLKYPEVFKYFDGLLNARVSQSIHAAGIVISPISLADNYGVFYKDGEDCLLLNMDEVHDIGLVKYDFLILSNIKIIDDTYKYIGKSYPRMHEINFDDPKVYEDMLRSPYGLFQFNSGFAFQALCKYKPKSISDITLINAVLRPSGTSYRDELLAHHFHKNPSEIIDNLLSDTLGFLVYQEQIIAFLQYVCGLSGSAADTVRRGIARKKPEILEASLPQIKDGYCAKSNKPREEAEKELTEFLQIIDDASSYMFNKNHSVAYSLITYICAYLRCYYPIEFVTSFLNNAANNDDIKAGAELAMTYGYKLIQPKYGKSGADYTYNKESKEIAKGAGSIAFMNRDVANQLYKISKEYHTDSFVELLIYIKNNTQLKSNQLANLINIDYFSDFGNIPTLSKLVKVAEFVKYGSLNQVNKNHLGEKMTPIVAKYATDRGVKGNELTRYKVTDVVGLYRELEDTVRAMKIPDIDLKVKIKNSIDILGYMGMQTNLPEDRFKLYINSLKPLKSKTSGDIWAYQINAISIGTGKSSDLTILAKTYMLMPVKKSDIIVTDAYGVKRNDKGYWTLYAYQREA